MDLGLKTIEECEKCAGYRIQPILSQLRRQTNLTCDVNQVYRVGKPGQLQGVVSIPDKGRYGIAHPNIYILCFSLFAFRWQLNKEQREHSTCYSQRRVKNCPEAHSKLLYQMSKQILCPANNTRPASADDYRNLSRRRIRVGNTFVTTFKCIFR